MTKLAPSKSPPLTPTAHPDPATMSPSDLRTTLTRIYSRLPPPDLHLLLSLRSLPTYGSPTDLALRLALHDLHHHPPPTPRIHTPPPTETELLDKHHVPDLPPAPPSSHLPNLPPELWADIFEWVNDWELATALNVHTALRPSHDWRGATALDRAILSGSPRYIETFISEHPTLLPTDKGVRAAIRFNYIPVLNLLHRRFPDQLLEILRNPNTSAPLLASRFGMCSVLDWWLRGTRWERNPLPAEYNEEPLDEASRKGHVHVLDWWKQSGLPLKYGAVLQTASSARQLDVLTWWLHSGLQLQYDRHPLRVASYRGHVDVLEWWKNSGLRLIYDKDVLVEATKFNRVEVLEWWRTSGLRVEYLLIEIDGALDDAVGGGWEAREWWRERGVTFERVEGRVREWMEYKVL